MQYANVVTISANTVSKPTGARTPADALGVTKRMSPLPSQSKESGVEQCPECDYTSETWHGIKVHYGCSHDGTLKPELECEWCGETFHVQPFAVDNRSCCSDACYAAQRAGTERPPAERLRELHHEQELHVLEIADRLGVVHSTVQNWMDELGVERRSQSEAERLKNKQRTEAERRKQAKAAHNAVREAVEAGEWHLQTENPERNGYGKGWTEEKRETVRELYDRECQACGLTGAESKERFGSRLDVHHVIPWSYFDDPEKRNAVENLIPMCRSCHRKWEGVPVAPKVIE